MEHLNHISIYIRGLNSDEKRKKLYEWLKIIKCDIAFIQETHLIECKKDIFKEIGMVLLLMDILTPNLAEEFLFFLRKH